jgi:lysophospholipase
MKKFVLPEVGNAPLFLLAHSMGGAISGLYMQKNPGVFSAAAMLTPMFAINIGDRKDWEAEALLSFYCATGKCQEYAPDRGDFKFDKEFKDDLDATSSQARWDHNENVMRQTPAIQLGGPTNGWVLQSLWATKGLRRNAAKFRDPLLVFSAGLDLTVENDAIEQVCLDAGDCEWVHFPLAKHQLQNEIDSMRDDAFQQIYDFFLNFQ